MNLSNQRSYPKREVPDRAQRPFVQIDASLIKSLDPIEFITYAQIKRRAGNGGECWESIPHMAEETSMSVNSLRKAIKGLLVKNLISKEKRPGGSDLYTLTPPGEWRLPKKIKILPTEPVQILPTEPVQILHPNKIPLELDPINQESKDFNASACPLSLAAGFIFQEPENLPVDNNHSTRPLTAREPVSQEDPEPESIQTSPASIQALPTLLAPAPESLVVENAPATPRSINGNKLRTNIFDKPNLLDSQRERADKGSILKIGIKNKRWKDLADYRKFENYVPEWVRLHPELVLGGQTALETQRGI